jgi:hypothetical protein
MRGGIRQIMNKDETENVAPHPLPKGARGHEEFSPSSGQNQKLKTKN